MRRSSSRAIRTRAVCSARARRPATRVLPAAGGQRARRDLELGPEVVQVPAQVVDQRGALRDEPLAVIDQQPDVELAGRPAARRAACRGPRAARRGRSRRRRSRRTCRARAPTRRAPAISFGAHAHDPLAAREQEALERAGDVPAVLDRPHPLAAEAARPDAAASSNERRLAAHRPLAEQRGRSPRRPRATVCERLCVSAPITIIRTVPSLGSLTNGSPADTSQSGRCHAPYLCRDPRQARGPGCRVELLGDGGACARLVVRVVCARAPSLISVHGPCCAAGRRHDG